MLWSWFKRQLSALTPELTPEGDPAVLLPAIEAIKQDGAAKVLALAEPFLNARHKGLSLDALRLCVLAPAELSAWYGEMRDKIDTDTCPLLDSFIEQLPAA